MGGPVSNSWSTSRLARTLINSVAVSNGVRRKEYLLCVIKGKRIREEEVVVYFDLDTSEFSWTPLLD
jgi:hypothetical protein